MASETGESNGIYHEDGYGSLTHLISIYPISSTIATHLPAGDLISLSRSSKTLRFNTHAFPDVPRSFPFGSPSQSTTNSPLTPSLHIGDHQTRQWAALKSLSPFICSFQSHKDPKSAKVNPCHACKFCSRPICKTCIVRSFFTDPKSSKLTYKYRARHLCPKCWSTGNLRKDFRYPADCVSREQIWKGRGYGQRGNWCGCAASEDNWVCGECRLLQNASGFMNLALSDVSTDSGKKREELVPASGDFVAVKCYGLDCDEMIDQVDRDRRRICLWCSKPLMRPYGGDDRLRWEEKQIEIRAAAAASRSADIHEWARNRFRNLTMSRREMRGTEACVRLTGSDGPEHDKPIFVRHLDTINYRKYMSERSSPSGDSVYQSKHGRWTYSREFLMRVDRCAGTENRAKVFPLPPGTDVETLFLLNMEIGLPGARTNSSPHFRRSPGPCDTILRYGAQLQNAGLVDQECLDWLLSSPHTSSSEMVNLKDKLFSYLGTWENLPEEFQLNWRPSSFWDLASEAGVLEDEAEGGSRTPGDEDEDEDNSRVALREGKRSLRNDTTPTDHRDAAEEDTGERDDNKAFEIQKPFSEDDLLESDDKEFDNESVFDDHAAMLNDAEANQDNEATLSDREREKQTAGAKASRAIRGRCRTGSHHAGDGSN